LEKKNCKIAERRGFGGLAPLLPTIYISKYKLITTFLTNSSCFQLKSTLEVL